jgi:hypothetical protein
VPCGPVVLDGGARHNNGSQALREGFRCNVGTEAACVAASTTAEGGENLLVQEVIGFSRHVQGTFPARSVL